MQHVKKGSGVIDNLIFRPDNKRQLNLSWSRNPTQLIQPVGGRHHPKSLSMMNHKPRRPKNHLTLTSNDFSYPQHAQNPMIYDESSEE